MMSQSKILRLESLMHDCLSHSGRLIHRQSTLKNDAKKAYFVW
jgi:hypothetical protein